MSVKKIIPCLDVKEGRVVKGVNFVNLRDAGDPVELATLYEQEGADELVLLDISATVEGRSTMLDVVRRVAEAISIPFTVGGGIANMDDVKRLLEAGADRIGINSAAVNNPSLVSEVAKTFGSERIVIAIDAKYNEVWRDWEVVTHGGKRASGLKALEWAEKVKELGAGQILLTSMDADGTKDGFDVQLTRAVADRTGIPVIASGGAGSIDHFHEVFVEGKAASGLAATIFHYRDIVIRDLKEQLRKRGVEMDGH